MTQPLRVMIVDDHAILRRGLALLVGREQDMDIVAEAASVDLAIDAAANTAPDVVLLDITAPGGTGFGAIHRLHAAAPDMRIVILAGYDDVEHVRRAVSEGGSGYVLKSSAHEVLLEALRTVGGGGEYRDPALPDIDGPNPPRGPIDALSPREREVLRLLALGNTNHEIADELVVSVKTVETHRAHIMNKLKADSRAQLVRLALTAGLLEPD